MIPKPPQKIKQDVALPDAVETPTVDETTEYFEGDLPAAITTDKVHVMHPAASPVQVRNRKAALMEDAGSGIVNVPADEDLYKRQYYSMREVADMFGANQSQIRFWENEFDILQPKKNKKGDRYFRPQDVKNLVLIHHLLRQRRFTIEGAKEYLKRHSSRAADTFQAIQSLEKLKAFLVEMKANLGS